MTNVTPFVDAPQHGPRPLPLFLAMLRERRAASADGGAAALAGLSAYQHAPRPRHRPEMPVRAKAGRATLRDYRGAASGGRPVVFVPSLINPPLVLDLSERNSLLRWLADQGCWPLLVDWGEPDPNDRTLDIGGHVTERLLPLLATLPEPPVLVGYCLGGTISLAAAASRDMAGVALIATPWHFSGFGEPARAEIAQLWNAAQPACDQLAMVPMEVLQSGFWRLDPERTIAKYEKFASMDLSSEAASGFIALEDWSNAGAPLTYAAGRELFDDFYDADLPGTGRWIVGGKRIDPAAIACPAIEFVSSTDRIVPAASSPMFADRRAISAGHVGMIIGSRARHELWNPLCDWLSAHAVAR